MVPDRNGSREDRAQILAGPFGMAVYTQEPTSFSSEMIVLTSGDFPRVLGMP